MSKKYLVNILAKAGLIVEGTTNLQGPAYAVTEASNDNSTKIATTAFVKSLGYITGINSGNVISALGYTPLSSARMITINGTSYDLSADRSWTITSNINARTEYEFTTNGSTATYTVSYSVGQVDVFYNGSKLSVTEFTASNGTSITLGFTPPSGQLVEVVSWQTGGGVSNGRMLTINGVSYDLSEDRSWTISAGITGSGTTNYLSKWTGSTSLGDSLLYDNGSAIGVNTTSPFESASFKLDINGGVIIKNTSGTTAQLILINSNPATGGNNGFVQLSAGGNTATAFGQWQTYYGTSNASGTLRLQPSGGVVLIGSTTAVTGAGMLQVTGDVNITGAFKINGTAISSGGLTSFNTRTGAITLSSTDVTNALGFTPVTNARTLTINGTSYDLTANRSWTISGSDATKLPLTGGTISGILSMATTGTNYIRMGVFPNSTSNSGEAWIGRASDRNSGTMTVQLGGGSASNRSFEVVDFAWSTVLFSVNSNGTVSASNFSGLLSGYVNQPTFNQPAIRVNSSGTGSEGSSIAIQQMTPEGWTGVFVDFEPNTGWGLYHDNPNNYFCVTAETSTGSLRSFTVPSRVSGNRTAHEKIRFDQVSGSILAGGNITAFSDGRVKTDVKVIDNAIDKLIAIRGVTYLRTDSEGEYKDKRFAGVIAQEVLQVLPEVVDTDKNTGMYSVAYGNMTALLIEAVKEQQAQIEELKTIINGYTK